MPVTLWGLLVVLKAVVTGLCFGIGFYLKDALIVYIRERKQEIESNLETRQPWHHNAQKQINKDRHMLIFVNLLTLTLSVLPVPAGP